MRRCDDAKCATDFWAGGKIGHRNSGLINLQDRGFYRMSPSLVRAVGLEPTRHKGLRILSPICLPFHHARIALSLAGRWGENNGLDWRFAAISNFSDASSKVVAVGLLDQGAFSQPRVQRNGLFEDRLCLVLPAQRD